MFVFAEITPRWPAASDPIRLCSATDRRAQGWDGERWAAAIVDPGQVVVDLFTGEFGGEIGIGIPAITITTREMEKLYPDAKSVRWESADVRMWAGEFTDSPGSGTYPYANTITPLCIGQVSKFEKDGDTIKLRVDPQDRAGKVNVLSLEYAGTGGAEGGIDKKGVLKPWVFGYAKNVEPLLIDEDNYVYQFSGYGPIQAVTALYERASDFGASLGDYANYAALVAAAIPEGRWATCLAEGMVRLGAPQYGVITGDVQGHLVSSVCIRKTGAIISAIAAARSIDVDASSMTALDAFGDTLPGDAHISLVLTEQTDVLSLARRLCAPLNAQAGVSLLGELFAVRINLASPTFTLESRGKRLPLVSAFSEADTPPPFKKVVMGADRSWRVHQLSSEVAFFAAFNERGIYDDAETYREGDIVSIADGSRWLYVNPAPSVGNDPVDVSVYWSRLSDSVAGTPGPAGADGASAFTLISVANVEFPTPNSVSPTGGTNGAWDKKAQTVQGGTAASITCQPGAAQSGAGLTTDPTANASFDTVDYWLHNSTGDGNLNVWRNGSFVATVGTAISGTGTLTVSSDGATVRYFKNGAEVYSHAVNTPGETIYGVLNITGNSDQITNVAFSVNGVNGATGPAGNSNAVVRLYQRSAASPAAPTGTFTYTFATGVLSGGSPGGWTQAIPAADGNPLWVIAASASAPTATDNIAAAEFSSPVIDTGAGVSVATVYLYKRGTSAPAVPSGTLTYTFATDGLAGTLDGWTRTIPSGTDPLYITQATAAGTGASDTIATGEWATVRILAQDGIDARLTNESHTLLAAADGAVSSYTGASGTFKIERAGTDLSGSFTLSTQANPQSLTIGYTGMDYSVTAGFDAGEDNASVTIRATGSGALAGVVIDKVFSLSKSKTGNVGDDALTVSIVPPAITVPSTFNGTPKAAVPGFQITVFQGGVDVSATATYGTIVASGVSGAAVDGDGTVTVTGMTADTGYVEVPISFGGISATARVGYAKVKDGNAAVSGEQPVTSLTNSGTYASSANFNISLANGQTFNANASVAYFAASGTYTSQMKLAYVNVTDGGAETDMAGSEATGGSATSTEPETNSTTGSFTNSSGGTKVFNIRLLTRRSAGAGNSTSVTGSVGGTG